MKFLEGWCDTNDLKQLFDRFENNLEKETYELKTVFDRALAYSMVNDNQRELDEDKLRVVAKAIVYLDKNRVSYKSINLLVEQYKNVLRNHLLPMSRELWKKYFSNRDLYHHKLYSLPEDIFKKWIFFENIIEKKFYDCFTKFTDDLTKNSITDSITFLSELFVITSIYSILSNAYNSSLLQGSLNYSPEIDLSLSGNVDIFLLLLLSKKQYHTAYQLFEESPELKDRLKPIYFLTMEYLKDEYPNEYLKAGEEMRETIEELKERVKWFEENLK